jgi:hypothetical protein
MGWGLGVQSLNCTSHHLTCELWLSSLGLRVSPRPTLQAAKPPCPLPPTPPPRLSPPSAPR